MATKEDENAVAQIPDSSSCSEPAIALDPMLLSELEKLDPQEQHVLSEFLRRAQRDRSVNGPMDELALTVNGLKDFPTEDEWLTFVRLRGKIAPDLHKEYVSTEKIPLSVESPSINKPISEVINNRTSGRDFEKSSLPFEKLSVLLCQSCGVRGTMSAYSRPEIPLRYFPSGGGLQCVELYLVINDVEKIPQGLYHYSPTQNCLEQIERGNFRWRVTNCCSPFGWVAGAGVVIFIAPDISRLTWKYGGYKSYRLAHLETGIVSQNLHLVATALGLGSCMLFGFDDESVDTLLGLDGRREFTTLLVAVGNKLDREPLLKKAVER